jgi:hypothetical protein
MRIGTSLIVVLCTAAIATESLGRITEWGPAEEGVHFLTFDSPPRIDILAPGTYWFQAVDDQTGSLEDINLIQILPGTSGTVTVFVERDPAEGGGPGAQNVQQVNLSSLGDGLIGGLNVAGNLGKVGQTIIATEMAGPIIVGGNIVSDIHLETFAGSITAYDMLNLSVTGDGPHTGDITLSGLTYDGTIAHRHT